MCFRQLAVTGSQAAGLCLALVLNKVRQLIACYDLIKVAISSLNNKELDHLTMVVHIIAVIIIDALVCRSCVWSCLVLQAPKVTEEGGPRSMSGEKVGSLRLDEHMSMPATSCTDCSKGLLALVGSLPSARLPHGCASAQALLIDGADDGAADDLLGTTSEGHAG